MSRRLCARNITRKALVFASCEMSMKQNMRDISVHLRVGAGACSSYTSTRQFFCSHDLENATFSSRDALDVLYDCFALPRNLCRCTTYYGHAQLINVCTPCFLCNVPPHKERDPGSVRSYFNHVCVSHCVANLDACARFRAISILTYHRRKRSFSGSTFRA